MFPLVDKPSVKPTNNTGQSNGSNDGGSGTDAPPMPISLFPFILFFAFLFLLAFGFGRHISRSQQAATHQQVAVPATSLIGGAEGIGPGQWLMVYGHTGGKDGTPAAEKWSVHGRVANVYSDETAKSMVYLLLPTEQAPTLRAAVAGGDGTQLVVARATPTSTSTPGPSPTPADTPTPTNTPYVAPPPISGQVGLEIPVSLIASGTAIDRAGDLSLVIVPKRLDSSEGTTDPHAPPPEQACVTFATFLDAERKDFTEITDGKKVDKVVVWLNASKLREAAVALTFAERVYLVSDGVCPTPTPTPTPTETPTETPTP